MSDLYFVGSDGLSAPVTPTNPLPIVPYQITRKTITFTGAAGLGAVGDVDLFTVTGEILVVAIIPFCTTNLVENGATTLISLGTTSIVAQFIAVSEPEDIDANEFWTAAAPVAGSLALPALLQDTLIPGAVDDILITVTTDTVTGGVLEVTLQWRPISADGAVVAA